MPEPSYQRLTRERASRRFAVAVMTRSSLWLGADHLLLVECTGFTETYKRFYFRDIQAIIIRKTRTRVVWNWILGVIVGLFALIMISAGAHDSQGTGAMITFGIFLLIFGIPLFFNNFFGPTCACEIRTAVQTGELSSLVRLRQAHRVLDKVRPFIVAAQGQLTAAEVAVRMRDAAESTIDQPESPVSGSIPPVIS